MAVMTSCCFCFSTRTGTIALGLLSLVTSFCTCVGLCFALINVDILAHDMKQGHDDYKISLDRNMTEPRYKIIDDLIGVRVIYENLKAIIIALIVFYAFYTFASLFMTYGSCTGLRKLLLPWIVLEFGFFAVQVAIIIILFVYGKNDPTLSKGGAYIIAGILNIIGFVIHVYWWMCPVAHYQTLTEETMIEALVPPSHPMYPEAFMKY
ncbi:uncharacterized protein LOC135198418 [Macrobrachium nipponense]|uniref:uncharacterized protein LOC135198418 n=1 Tax=Macrobrachium nipponense TaxID=159736 RepID=UPI0030C80A5B